MEKAFIRGFGRSWRNEGLKGGVGGSGKSHWSGLLKHRWVDKLKLAEESGSQVEWNLKWQLV